MIFDGVVLLPPMRLLATHSSAGMMRFGDQQRFGLLAERVQVFDGEVVGEDHVFVGAMEPMRCARPRCHARVAEARLGEDGMARAERDELARRQSPVARERFEDVADVGVGDPDLFARHAPGEVRAAFLLGCGLHTQ